VVELAGNPCLCGALPTWFNVNNSDTASTGLGASCLAGNVCAPMQPLALASVDAAGECSAPPAGSQWLQWSDLAVCSAWPAPSGYQCSWC
jgi:hypothetical protein